MRYAERVRGRTTSWTPIRRAGFAAALVALSACGARTGVEAPEPDASSPQPDAAADAALPDAGEHDRLLDRVALVITVGDDSLGDTDALRPAVSEDFAFVRFADGRSLEVGLNEGATWSAGTTHRREIAMTRARSWRDVRAVGIRHVAAGDDWNADNWTMNAIVIESISLRGRAVARYRETGDPIWQFRKNDHQVWEREL